MVWPTIRFRSANRVPAARISISWISGGKLGHDDIAVHGVGDSPSVLMDLSEAAVATKIERTRPIGSSRIAGSPLLNHSATRA